MNIEWRNSEMIGDEKCPYSLFQKNVRFPMKNHPEEEKTEVNPKRINNKA